jgi:YD repeat-containing protein
MKFAGAQENAPGALVVFNPVVDGEYTTLLDDNQPIRMSAKTFQYDFNGNLVQEIDYDWFNPSDVTRDGNGVPTGVPLNPAPTVLRIINNSYHNPATSTTSDNVYAKRSVSNPTPLILNATQQTTIGPPIELGRVQLSYDGQAYGVAPTRGNLTNKSAWDNLDNKWITSSNTYDGYGNLTTATDARGKITQFFYDDARLGLPNHVTVDPQNGTGTQTTSTTYDLWTGLVTSSTDSNNQVSTINYANPLLGGAIDPFGRPGLVTEPLVNAAGVNQRHRTTTRYLDSVRQVIVASDLNSEDDQLLKTRTTVDQLGRVILSEQTEDGTNYTISSQTVYNSQDRMTFTSNPHRATAATTDGWTRTTTDRAGRIVEVATFSGSLQPGTGTADTKVVTSYDAEFTTVTDQAGRVRRSKTDALGRLVRIDEPNDATPAKSIIRRWVL